MKMHRSKRKPAIMFNLVLLLIGMMCSCLNPDPKSESMQDQDTSETTYYLIRHAEKDRSNSSNPDPELNSEGVQRAEKWAKVLKDVDFDAVYSTDYKRTVSTAKPVADKNDLEIQLYDPNDLYSKEFQKATKGKTVLVVGHSNTTPKLANAMLKKEKYKDIDDSENGALFIVTINENQAESKVLYIN